MRSFGIVLLVVVLVAAGTVGGSRLVTTAIKAHTSPRQWERHTTGMGRAIAAWQQLELAQLHPNPKAYILGSSISMGATIEPETYKTFNFGFFAAAPSLLDWFAREIERQDDSRPDIIALEFLPHFTTLAADRSLLDSTALRKAALLNVTTLPWLQHAPWKESMTVVLDWLRGVSAPEITVNILNQQIDSLRPRPKEDIIKEDIAEHERLYDLTELTPSTESLAIFVAMVKRLAPRTRCLVLFTPPENTGRWRRSEQGERNLRFMLESIAAATGRKVLRFEDNYSAALFRDATHLDRPRGQERFNQELSSLVAQECSEGLK